jgi:ligand-binding sensor domain-containing protein
LTDKRRPPGETEIEVGSQSILFDNDGALWITSLGDGLRRASAPELLKGPIKGFSTAVESFTSKDGLSDDLVRAILKDREGNIWVGTNNGLDRFRKTNLVPLAPSSKSSYALLATGDAGVVWLTKPYQAAMFQVHGGRASPSHPIPSEVLSRARALCTVIPLVRSGGFAGKASIAITREPTPNLRYRRRFRSLT